MRPERGFLICAPAEIRTRDANPVALCHQATEAYHMDRWMDDSFNIISFRLCNW